MNLIDLASSGSPRASLQMDETKSINKSLSQLSLVIKQLAKKEQFISYRDSQLTRLLEPSLGGNAKTLMIATVSPNQEHFSESLKTLRYAAEVNSCKLKTAMTNRRKLSQLV